MKKKAVERLARMEQQTHHEYYGHSKNTTVWLYYSLVLQK